MEKEILREAWLEGPVLSFFSQAERTFQELSGPGFNSHLLLRSPAAFSSAQNVPDKSR